MIIRHKRFKDVCFEVDHFTIHGNAVGRWINMGYVKSWYIKGDIMGLVSVQQPKDWMQIVDTTVDCLRYGNWVPL